ncbi:MAG: hypothetical protein V3T31_10975 [candidate division Zixibacteria bacterium]
MTDKPNKSDSPDKRVSSSQRFKYIGFEVFPGKPKDLFNTEAEKNKLIDEAKERRDKGDTIRDNNTLMLERISFGERLVLTVACLVIVGSLFLPWYSAYTEIVQESSSEIVLASDSLATDSLMTDSLAVDSMATGQPTDSVAPEMAAITEPEPTSEVAEATEEADTAAATASTSEASIGGEEIITAHRAKKQVHREYETVSWFGALGVVGSAAGYLFSSGVMAISVILLIVYMLLSILLPAYTLYSLFGTKEVGDKLALNLKNTLRYNWLPVILVTVVFVLSFFGSGYSFEAAGMFDSFGKSYSIMALGSTLSWGFLVSLGMFVLIAVKGIEI